MKVKKKVRQFYQEKIGVTPSVVVQGDMHPSDATAHIFGVHTIAKRQSLGPVMFRLIRTGKIQKVCEVLANELAVTCRITQPDSVLSIICWLLVDSLQLATTSLICCCCCCCCDAEQNSSDDGAVRRVDVSQCYGHVVDFLHYLLSRRRRTGRAKGTYGARSVKGITSRVSIYILLSFYNTCTVE